jgi:broad specificity phosphatase PhoE
MKEVYVIRHAEKDESGELTEQGRQQAKQLRNVLPKFAIVTASTVPRTIETATLATGREPIIDSRASFYTSTQEVSADIRRLATERSITFFEAADMYNGGALADGIHSQAVKLNELLDETLERLNDSENALVVSHDMTITPAMALRGQPRQSISYLSGYVIARDGAIKVFDAAQAITRTRDTRNSSLGSNF